MEDTSEDGLDHALSLFDEGLFKEAEEEVRAVLARDPRSVRALHLLAAIAAQTKRRVLAIELLRQAEAMEPDSSEILTDLGELLRSEGSLTEAIHVLQRAVAADPQSSLAR